MRDLCLRCLRPKNSCYCPYTKDVDCKIKFVFLMHPKEARKQRTGTGRLAHLCLPESEIIVGIDFTHNQHLNNLLNDPKYFPMLMYPGDDVYTAKSGSLLSDMKGRTPLIIIIDSTWFCSKKMIKESMNVNTLPRISFYGSYKSIFTFKHEPEEYCVSTIESCYYIIKEFQDQGLAPKEADPEPLMNVFKQMILHQINAENDRIASGRPGNHAYDSHYNKIREVPDFKIE